MDMTKLISEFEDKKEGAYKKMLGNDFDELITEARKNPEIAAYLDLKLTKEEVIGYLIASARVAKLSSAQLTEIVIEMERHFMTMSPEEAEAIYAESFYGN